jgi:hypothetical protein
VGALAYGCLAPIVGDQAAIMAIAIVTALAAFVGFLLFERMRCLTSGQPRSSPGGQTSATAI